MESYYINNILQYFWSDKSALISLKTKMFDNLTMFVFLQRCSIALLLLCIVLNEHLNPWFRY